MQYSLSWLSGLFDNYVVDGLVNFASNVTLDVGGRLRRLQTGSINGYLYGILAAVMLILLVRAMLREHDACQQGRREERN